jgi:hypothetical protein
MLEILIILLNILSNLPLMHVTYRHKKFGRYYINDISTSQNSSTTSNAIVQVHNFHSRLSDH